MFGSKKTEKKNTTEMSFLGHVEALRWHLMRAAIVIITLAVVLFIYDAFVFGTIIFGPLKTDFLTYRAMCKISHLMGLGDQLCMTSIPIGKLYNTNLSGQFTMDMWVAFIGALVLGFPYLIFELWRFIKPALHDKETKGTKGFVFFASFLFISGVLFSYFIVVPLTVLFLGGYKVSGEDVVNIITMDSYISNVTTLTLITGIVFELPILVFFLTKFGIMSPGYMRKYRRHAVVIIMIAAAIITPSSDIATLLVVATPLYILYELSIFVSMYVVRKQDAALAKQ